MSAIYNGGWFVPQFLGRPSLAAAPPQTTRVWCRRRRPYYLLVHLLSLPTYALGVRQSDAVARPLFHFNDHLFVRGGVRRQRLYDHCCQSDSHPAARALTLGWPRIFRHRYGFARWGSGCHRPESRSRGYVFPENFRHSYSSCCLAPIGSGLLLFALVRAAREYAIVERRSDLCAAMGRGPCRIVSANNRNYRRYLFTRFILAAGDLATPFYALFAIKQLGAPLSIVGLYIGFTTISALLSSPVLSWLSDHHNLNGVLLLARRRNAIFPLLALGFR